MSDELYNKVTEHYLQESRDKIYEEELKGLKADIGDFLIAFQEAAHPTDSSLKSLYSAYMKVENTKSAAAYAVLGHMFAGLIDKEFQTEAENLTEDRMVREYE